MKERPILFSSPMVRSLLNCTKSQTRRAVKGFALELLAPDGFTPEYVAMPENRNCPYGYAGDRLFVRETWAEVGTMDPGLIVYRADYPDCVPHQYENVQPASKITWKPSIHMFRRHSRINLEITGVRVERLNDITQDDAKAEGVEQMGASPGLGLYRNYLDPMTGYIRPDDAFSSLWNSINGAGSWESNPWVWVVEFRRVTS